MSIIGRYTLISDGKIRNKNRPRITARSWKASSGKKNRWEWGACSERLEGWTRDPVHMASYTGLLPRRLTLPSHIFLVTSSQTSGVGAFWFSNQKEGDVLFNYREIAQHGHTTELLEDTSSACPLASKPQRRQLKLGEVLTEKQKAAFFLKHQRPAQNGYTSARRVLIHYSVFLIHYKLHLNFLAHVHL